MMLIRPRRNRSTKAIRQMVQENQIGPQDLIAPLFVKKAQGGSVEIKSMPNQWRYCPDDLLKECEKLLSLGVSSIALFAALEDDLKDKNASESKNLNGLYCKSIKAIKERFKDDLLVMSDVAMDPYSSDGHDGIVKDGKILNDETLPILAQMACAQAQSGADIIGPSDMMDGRIGYIRSALDESGFSDTQIMSYCAKYASAFYGPFRDALDSAPKSGDKKTYQMNPANKKEALREALLDESEGADILMVKPALSYLDVISTLSENSNLPIAAYNVSGEYAMVCAAQKAGWLDGDAVMNECLLSMKRAGADIVLTYFSKRFCELYR